MYKRLLPHCTRTTRARSGDIFLSVRENLINSYCRVLLFSTRYTANYDMLRTAERSQDMHMHAKRSLSGTCGYILLLWIHFYTTLSRLVASRRFLGLSTSSTAVEVYIQAWFYVKFRHCCTSILEQLIRRRAGTYEIEVWFRRRHNYAISGRLCRRLASSVIRRASYWHSSSTRWVLSYSLDIEHCPSGWISCMIPGNDYSSSSSAALANQSSIDVCEVCVFCCSKL